MFEVIWRTNNGQRLRMLCDSYSEACEEYEKRVKELDGGGNLGCWLLLNDDCVWVYDYKVRKDLKGNSEKLARAIF